MAANQHPGNWAAFPGAWKNGTKGGYKPGINIDTWMMTNIIQGLVANPNVPLKTNENDLAHKARSIVEALHAELGAMFEARRENQGDDQGPLGDDSPF